MTVDFTRHTILATDPASAFDASLDVDLHLRSFEKSGETVIGGVASGGMSLGDTVTWRARHFGVWWTMTSKITEYDRPTMFVDEQERGPFRRFRHVHRFAPLDDGRTSMTDEISFDAPLGVLGRIAERAALARYVPKLIDLRNAELVAHFETPTPST